MGKQVLVVGLDPHRVPGPWDPEPVATAVARGMAELVEAGYDAVPCWVGLNLVRVHAPQARIAFNEAPDELLAAIRRQLG